MKQSFASRIVGYTADQESSAWVRRYARRCWLALGCTLWAITVFMPWSASGVEARIAYSFSSDGAGGIAEVSVDTEAAKFLTERVLLREMSCQLPAKLRRTPDGAHLALANLHPSGPHLFFVDTQGKEPTQVVQLPSPPDELRFGAPDVTLYVTCEGDSLAAVRWSRSPSVRVVSLAKLRPPGNAPEDLCLVAAEQQVVVSCQKDGRGGKKLGNRLLILDAPTWRVVADLPVPRARPDLHIAGDPKEQGPGPEVLAVSTRTDSLAVTLDLYGAVGLMSWRAAREGRVDNFVLLNMSPNAIWGTAFPDRGCLITWRERDYFLVNNAGAEGGATLIDLQNRSICWQGVTPAGLEQPVLVPSLGRVYSVCSGKTKRRMGVQIEKTMHPQAAIFGLDLDAALAHRATLVEQVALEQITTRLHLVADQPPLFLLASGEDGDHLQTLILWDPQTGQIRDRHTAHGWVQQFER